MDPELLPPTVQFLNFLIFQECRDRIVEQAVSECEKLAGKHGANERPTRGMAAILDLVKELGTFPQRRQVPKSILQRVLQAIERTAARRGYSSGEAFAIHRGERGRFSRLRHAVNSERHYSVEPLADLISNLGLTLADLTASPLWPWNDLTGLPIVVCVGAPNAERKDALRPYKMLQRDDVWAGMMLIDFFRRLPITDRVELFTPSASQEAEQRLAQLDKTGGALIVVGSEHANPAWAAATSRMPGAAVDGYALHLSAPPYSLTRNGANKAPACWRRDSPADAGLLRIWRRETAGNNPFVIAVAAGLGPAGTLAAAQAMTCAHEVAARLDFPGHPNYLARAVIVPKANKLTGALDLETLEQGADEELTWVWDDQLS